MPGRAAANLLITDKRSDGYLTYSGWGLDWQMDNLDRTIRLPGRLQNAANEFSEWSLTAVKPIPELNAAVLACHAGSQSMVLANWTQVTGTYWKTIQPQGYQLDWLKWYDATADTSGAVRLNTRWVKNPTWRLCFLRAQPPVDQTEPVAIAITLNSLGTIQYRLTITQRIDETSDSLADVSAYYPTLEKSIDAGATFDTVDQWVRDDAANWAYNAFEQPSVIYCRYLKDHLVISLGDQSAHWIYYEQDLEIPEGHVQVAVSGGQIAFTTKLATYMQTGTIERQVGIVPPSVVNPVADTTEVLYGGSEGGIIAHSMETDGVMVWPKMIISGSSPYYYTPVVYQFQARRPAVWASPVTTALFDNANVTADKGKLLWLEYYIAEGWRGSTFRAALRTTTGLDEYALSGMEKAKISTALDTGTPSFTTQVTCYLEYPSLVADGRDPNQFVIEVSGRDRMVFFDQPVLDCPSFGGWTYGDAIYWLLHQIAGIPDADLAFDSEIYDDRYHTPTSTLELKFPKTETVQSALDYLCKAAGREWGIHQNGQVFTRLRNSVAYSGTPDFTLDEATVTDDDKASFVELKADPWGVRNHVIAYGSDSNGTEQQVSLRSIPSMNDPTNDAYVGRARWQVIDVPEGSAPALVARQAYDRGMRNPRYLRWQTPGKPTLFPDHFVEVSVSNLDVPDGTVFRITEKRGYLHAETGEYVDEFIGVVGE